MQLSSTPDIQSGQVCIDGTRIPVSAIWRYFAAGFSIEHVADEYPSLTLCQITAARDMVKFNADLKEPETPKSAKSSGKA
jgi:uncharacterized protein (DUF433 family)